MAKKKNITSDFIISSYMDYVLNNNKQPQSVFSFTKENNFDEALFYQHFASFDALENSIFSHFFTNTLEVLNNSDEYNSYDSRNKLLSFYFTFFENLTANRSFVVYALTNDKMPLKNLKKLKELRTHFLDYVDRLDIQTLQLKEKRLEEIKDKTFLETYWAQLLFTIKFWLDDTSPSFQKTDIYIEKSINASFDLLNIAPFKSLLDFGKFLFKEKVNLN